MTTGRIIRGANAPTNASERTFRDDLNVVRRNLGILTLGPLIVASIAVAASFLITPTFTSTSKFLPPQQQQSAAATMLQSLGALGSLAGAAGLKNPSDQYVAFLKSRFVQDALVERFGLIQRYDSEFKQDARGKLEARTKILASKDGIITIDFDDKDPKFAADVTNGYVEELGALLNRLAVTEAQQRRKFFELQLTTTKDNLIKAEQSLAASGVGASALNTAPAIALEGPARLRAQVTAQEVKLASLRSYLKEGAPEYRQASAELAELRSQLKKVEREQPGAAGGSNDYIAKYREFKYQETLFELFSKQYEIAKIDESREGAVIQVIDVAQPAEYKSKPVRSKIGIIAFLLSGIAIFAFVFLRARFRSTRATSEV